MGTAQDRESFRLRNTLIPSSSLPSSNPFPQIKTEKKKKHLILARKGSGAYVDINLSPPLSGGGNSDSKKTGLGQRPRS